MCLNLQNVFESGLNYVGWQKSEKLLLFELQKWLAFLSLYAGKYCPKFPQNETRIYKVSIEIQI